MWEENVNMKFICCADLHFTDKTPPNRVDNYFETQCQKLHFILHHTEINNAALLVAGDIFDSAKAPYKVTKRIMNIIQKYNVPIYITFGQHDLNYHKKGLENTPLGTLSTLENITILQNDKTVNVGGITIIGAGWNEEPEIEADILITHQMITHKGPLFPGQKDYSTARRTLKKYPWAKVIVSGDNHEAFVLRMKKQKLINCGSMMRKRKDQMWYFPCIWLLDTDNWLIEEIEIDIQASSDVFDLEKIEREEIQEDMQKQAKENINDLIDSLDMKEKTKPKFETMLARVIKKTKPNKNVVNIINDLMEEVGV